MIPVIKAARGNAALERAFPSTDVPLSFRGTRRRFRTSFIRGLSLKWSRSTVNSSVRTPECGRDCGENGPLAALPGTEAHSPCRETRTLDRGIPVQDQP